MVTQLEDRSPQPAAAADPMTKRRAIRNALVVIVCVTAVGDIITFNTAAHLGCKGSQDFAKGLKISTDGYYNDAAGNQWHISNYRSPNAVFENKIDYTSDLCEEIYFTCRALPINCDQSAFGWAATRKLNLGKYSIPLPYWSLWTMILEGASFVYSCLTNIFVFIGFLFKLPAFGSVLVWGVAASVFQTMAFRVPAALKDFTDHIIDTSPPLSKIGKENALGDADIATAVQVAEALSRKETSFADQIEFDE